MTPLDPMLHELADEHRQLSAPVGVERALISEFRRRRRRGLWPWMSSAGALAAAGVALAFYIVQPPPAETIALYVAAPAAPEVRFTPKPAVAARAVEPRPAKPVVQAEAYEIATDFFPLRAGPVLVPGELAQVVRTRVPRRELRRFGLAQPDFYPSVGVRQDIRADIVFGYDGTARAIRFVHDSQ